MLSSFILKGMLTIPLLLPKFVYPHIPVNAG